MIPNNMNVPKFTNLFKVYLSDIFKKLYLSFEIAYSTCIINLMECMMV